MRRHDDVEGQQVGTVLRLIVEGDHLLCGGGLFQSKPFIGHLNIDVAAAGRFPMQSLRLLGRDTRHFGLVIVEYGGSADDGGETNARQGITVGIAGHDIDVALTQSFRVLPCDDHGITDVGRGFLPEFVHFLFQPGVDAEQVCLMTTPDGLIIVGAMYEYADGGMQQCIGFQTVAVNQPCQTT